MFGQDDSDWRLIGIDPLMHSEVAHEFGYAVAIGFLCARGQAEIAKEDLTAPEIVIGPPDS